MKKWLKRIRGTIGTRRGLIARANKWLMDVRWRLIILLCVLVLGCRSPSVVSQTVVITQIDTIVTQESELLAGPSELGVLADGRLLVTDGRANRLLLLEADGALVRTIGGPGSGPGEFQRPRSSSVYGDTIRVLDAGNGRIQTLTLGGTVVSQTPMPPDAQSGSVTFLPTHGYLVSRNGRDSVLVQRFGQGGNAGTGFGRPVVAAPAFWHFPTVKELIREGTVPAHLRNTTTSVAAGDGTTWLILVAEGVVQRFDARDSLLWALQLAEPELVEIREDFFRRNQAEDNPSVLYPLMYVVDAQSVGEELWLLLGSVDERGTTIVVVGAAGVVARHIRLPGLDGVRQFAVDGTAQHLYLVAFDDALLLHASLR